MSSTEELNQHQPRDESANVRRISNAALLSACAQHAESANQLECKPDPDRDPCRNVREETEENYRHTACGMKQHITSQHSGNRTGSTQARNEHVRLLAGESRGGKHVRQ